MKYLIFFIFIFPPPPPKSNLNKSPTILKWNSSHVTYVNSVHINLYLNAKDDIVKKKSGWVPRRPASGCVCLVLAVTCMVYINSHTHAESVVEVVNYKAIINMLAGWLVALDGNSWQAAACGPSAPMSALHIILKQREEIMINIFAARVF